MLIRITAVALVLLAVRWSKAKEPGAVFRYLCALLVALFALAMLYPNDEGAQNTVGWFLAVAVAAGIGHRVCEILRPV